MHGVDLSKKDVGFARRQLDDIHSDLFISAWRFKRKANSKEEKESDVILGLSVGNPNVRVETQLLTAYIKIKASVAGSLSCYRET